MEVAASPHVIRAAYGSVPLSVEAARAPGRGTAAMGQSLGNVASVLDEQAMKMAHAKNTVDLLGARREQKDAANRFAVFQAENADEELWGPQAEKEIETTKKNIAGLKLSPVAQKQFELEQADFEQQFRFEVKHAAVKQGVRRIRERTFMDAEKSAASGDVDEMEATIKGGVKTGAIDKKEAEIKIGQLKVFAEQSKVTRDITNSPKTAVASLKAKDKEGRWINHTALSEVDRLQLLNTAETAWATKRHQTVQDLTERILKKDTVGLDKVIAYELENENILASQAKNLLSQIVGDYDLSEVNAKGGVLLERVQGLDPKSKQYDKEVLAIRAEALALHPSVVKTVEDVIARIEKTGPITETKPKVNADDLLLEHLRTDVFGKYRGTDETPYEIEMEDDSYPWQRKRMVPVLSPSGKPIVKVDITGQPIVDEARAAINLRQRTQALGTYQQAVEALGQFRATNPKATPAQEIDYINKWTDAYRKKAARRIDIPTTSSP